MNLLIADDEAIIRRGLVSLNWKSIGIDEVYSASNGEEAKHLLLSEHLDLVLFDIRMPGLTGLELTELVKEYSLDTAVVLLTGFSEFEYVRDALRFGVYDYLLKPIAPDELLDVMEQVKKKLEQERYQRDLIQKYEEKKGLTDTVSQVENQFKAASPTIRKLILEMAEHFHESLSLQEMAEKYHFTVSYLSKRIRKETSYSFIEILNAIRLMNAANLMLEGQKINRICEQTGFRDQHYFSQLFKRVFDCTPSEYKKMEAGRTVRLFQALEMIRRKGNQDDE